MTISYNNNIPAANDNPSVDQPNMRVNTNAVDTLLQVDHVSFNTASGGTHKQVTFSSNNVPVPPVSPPVLFTDVILGVPQLKFYSGSAIESSNQYVSTTNGSVLLLGGIIIKWGQGVSIGTPFVFPVAFPHACFSVVVVGTSNAYTGGFVVRNLTFDTFLVTRTDGSSGSTGYNYIAIGN